MEALQDANTQTTVPVSAKPKKPDPLAIDCSIGIQHIGYLGALGICCGFFGAGRGRPGRFRSWR